MHPAFRLHPSLVLGAYAEELVVGARVALFGDATLELTGELVERGARLVHVYDLDAVRAAEAGARAPRRSVVFGKLPDDGDLGVRDGAFDLVFVPDLSFTPAPKAILQMARRILARSGTAIVASPNPEATGATALPYYELYDAIASAFRQVRMLGQAPFVGYVVAEFATDGEPDVSVDTSLVEAAQPEWFVAIASERDVRLEPYALIELPAERAPESEPPAAPPPPAVDREMEEALERAEAHAKAALADVERLGAERDRGAAERATAIAERDRAKAERDSATGRARELEQALEREQRRSSELEAKLQGARAEAERLRADRAAVAAALADERTNREAAEREAESLRENPELVVLRERVGELERAGAGTSAASEEHEAELGELERHLREQGARVEELRREVSRRDRLVRELVGLLEEREQAAAPAEAEPEPDGALADLETKLDRLAGDAARKEADLTAAAWRIAELERRLARQGS